MPTKHPSRTCTTCAEPFTPNRPWQKRCPQCIHNPKPRTLKIRICPNCNTQFTPTHGNQIYCTENRCYEKLNRARTQRRNVLNITDNL